jgi:hypothetical protein
MGDNGIPVFPTGRNKRPVWSNEELGLAKGEGGLKQATTDADQIERMFAHPGTIGIGMPTGEVSGFTVIDVDCGKGKPKAMEARAWLEKHRREILPSRVNRTASGGLHYLFRYTPGIKSATDVFGPGVDCRNDGGYIVVPPTPGYEVKRWLEDEDLGTVPLHLVVQKGEGKRAEVRAGEVPPEVLAQIATIRANAGQWHNDMIRLVAHLVGSGWGDAEILRHVPDWTGSGFTHRETFDEVAVAIAGARAKWDQEKKMAERNENAVAAIKRAVRVLTPNQIKDLHSALGGMIRD